jgi:hypothetical protein
VSDLEITPIAPDDWWPPEYETVFEFPSNIVALWTIRERAFAQLEDGRTVDITSVVNGTKQ